MHQHTKIRSQPLPVPEWKWEVISMDFITGFPRIVRKHDSIMVVMDKLSKLSHCIPIKSTHKVSDVVNIFMRELFKFHGLPKAIVSNRDVKFTFKVFERFVSGIGNSTKIL